MESSSRGLTAGYFHFPQPTEDLSEKPSTGACDPWPPGVAAASPSRREERPQIASSMWTLGRRAAASLLPGSAPSGSSQARAGSLRQTKASPLHCPPGLRPGTSATGGPGDSVSTSSQKPRGLRAGGGRPRTPGRTVHARRARAPLPLPRAELLWGALPPAGLGLHAWARGLATRLCASWVPWLWLLLSGEQRETSSRNATQENGTGKGRAGGRGWL